MLYAASVLAGIICGLTGGRGSRLGGCHSGVGIITHPFKFIYTYRYTYKFLTYKCIITEFQ